MPKTTTSQSQHKSDVFPFDPSAGLAAWHKMTDAYVDRLETLHGELGQIQARGMEQGRVLIDEAANLMKASMNYAGRLQDEWRKMALDATRRVADTTTD